MSETRNRIESATMGLCQIVLAFIVFFLLYKASGLIYDVDMLS
jgi:hypothetical protein